MIPNTLRYITISQPGFRNFFRLEQCVTRDGCHFFHVCLSFPLSSQNQLTPAQRQALLPVMESVLRVMESDKPSVNDVNTLMVQVRDLLKKVPEGYLPNLRQFGFSDDNKRTQGSKVDVNRRARRGLLGAFVEERI